MAALGVDVNVAKDDGETNIAVNVPESVLRRDQARLEEAERRRNAKQSQTVTEEKSDFFTSTFNAEKTQLEEMISSCNDRETAAKALEEATVKFQQLQKFLNDSVMFLTQYEIRQAQESLQKLQSSISDKREEVLPKKKFAFRSKNTSKQQQPTPIQQQTPDKPASDSVGTVVVGAAAIPADQCGFSNVDNQVLFKQAEEIQQRDVLLSHLTHCKVRLYGCPSTLHIKNIRSCEILCGPVSSSVFVDQCTDSTLVFPCQQLRTHNTTATQVYLHVTSRAIIEDCHGLSFAPFTWTYSGIRDHFKIAGLSPDRNNWREVDDFNWLATGTPSPNWTVIPEAERICSWDFVGTAAEQS